MNDFKQDKDVSFNKLDPKNWKLNNKKEGSFQCPDCKKIFNTKSLRKKHRREVHGIECPHCNKMVLKNKMKSHINRYHTPITCPICNEICNNKRDLSKHKRKHHSEEVKNKVKAPGTKVKKKKSKRTYKCPHCNIEFSYKNYLKHDKRKCLQKKIDAFVYSKDRDKRIDEDSIRITSNGNKKRMSCDLHELFLDEAKSVIGDTIKACVREEIDELEIIHGYKHGQVLKNYIRSKNFIPDFSSPNLKIQVCDTSDPGVTIVKIK